jgi:hypothetical protein
MIDIVLCRSSIQGSEEDIIEPVASSEPSGKLDFPSREHSRDVAETEACAASADRKKREDNRDLDIFHSLIDLDFSSEGGKCMTEM